MKENKFGKVSETAYSARKTGGVKAYVQARKAELGMGARKSQTVEMPFTKGNDGR